MKRTIWMVEEEVQAGRWYLWCEFYENMNDAKQAAATVEPEFIRYVKFVRNQVVVPARRRK